MDPFYAFLTFALLLIIENLAAQAGLPLYFRFGLPLYFRRKSLDHPPEPAGTVDALEASFRASPAHPSIRFKPLDQNTIAFREALFENRPGFRYLPVMHSTLRLNPEQNSASVTGFANLSVLFVLGYLVYRAGVDPSFIPVAILVVFVLALSYLAQASLNTRILAALTAAQVKEPAA